MPVLIVTDKYVGESYSTVKPFDDSKYKIDRGKLVTEVKEDYKRYEITKDGVSPRVIPGVKNGMHTATSYEHDEFSFESEDEDNKIMLTQKRKRKFLNLAKTLPAPELVGDKNAEFVILSWGSTKGPILQAMELLEKEKIKTSFLQIKYISPFPTEEVLKLTKEKKIILIENNETGQLGGILRELSGKEVDYKILKYDGRAFFPREIQTGIKNIIKNEKEKVQVFSKNKNVAVENFGVK